MKVRSQQGSARVIITIVLAVGLLGALGWIFWQNFLQGDGKKEASRATQNIASSDESQGPEIPDVEVFSDGSLSFDYDPKNWKLYEAENYTALRSSDYESYVGMGLKSGAEIIVNTYNTSANDPLNPSGRQAYGYSEVEAATVAGYPAYKYKLSYEGIRYGADFDANGNRYAIVVQISGDELTLSQKAALNLAIDTATLK